MTMKGFKNTTRTLSGHRHWDGGSTGAPVQRFAQGGPVRGARDSVHGLHEKGGVADFHPYGEDHGLLRRQTPMTEELKEAGGTSPLRAGFKKGGSAKHFHVHKHYHAKGGKISTTTKSYRSVEHAAEGFAEGGHVHDSTTIPAGYPDYAKGGKTMKPGGGGRFAALKSKLAKRPGVTNPGALAASIGRKKYGGEKMAKFSAQGRSRAVKKNAGGALYATGGTINKLALGGVPMSGTPAVGALGRLALRPQGLPSRAGPPMRKAMPMPGPTTPIMRAKGGKVHEDAAEDRPMMERIAHQEVMKHVGKPAPTGHKGLGKMLRR